MAPCGEGGEHCGSMLRIDVVVIVDVCVVVVHLHRGGGSGRQLGVSIWSVVVCVGAIGLSCRSPGGIPRSPLDIQYH